MCGIAGYWNPKGESAARLGQLGGALSASLRHRGPDGEGIWHDAAAGVVLAHRRLKVLDLSPTGSQPMASRDGRYVITYNGEIYNFRTLKRELQDEGSVFVGTSDTEVLVRSIECWGIKEALRRAHGMFAFALWDRERRELVLARDRVGIKPLYWGWVGGALIFGSQLKPFFAAARGRLEIDRDALQAYVSLGYVPAPKSILRGIRQVDPGHFVTINGEGDAVAERYWIRRVFHVTRHAEPTDQVIDALENTIAAGVRSHMVSDVPLGAFLSGGVDSSTVVALMQAQRTDRVKTFTIGFTEAGFDEAYHARRIAAHLGTDHTEVLLTERDAVGIVPNLPRWFDEPFGDSSALPTLFLSGITREHVTVALSGDGGDELFAGYRRYHQARSLAPIISSVPQAMRSLVGAAIRMVPPKAWDRMLGNRHWLSGDRLHKATRLLEAVDRTDLYRRLMTHWPPDRPIVPGANPSGAILDLRDDLPYERALQELDFVTYLPNDILTKLDRASMAVSLEARVPILDDDVIEFAGTLGPKLLISGGISKWALRQVAYRHIPAEFLDRPKQGFAVPIGQWLRGELRDWAESLLDRSRLENDELFDADVIHRHWREHLSGARNWHHFLWSILMALAWKRLWFDEPPEDPGVAFEARYR